MRTSVRFMMTAVVVVPLALSACADGPSDTTTQSLAGGALGAAGGAAIGAIAGNAALGAAIGGGVGLLGGYFNNQYEIRRRE